MRGPLRTALLVAAACGLARAQDTREIVRRSVQMMDRNLARGRDYAFLERSESRELDSDNRVKRHKVVLYDVTLVEGSPYRRLAGRDDHPLSQDEERAEQNKLQNSIVERHKETQAERAARGADWEKRQQRWREPMKEVPDAFNFQIAGEELIDGRAAWVLIATPRPGYRARSNMAKLFPKLRGKLWIDKEDGQWVKTTAEVTSDFSWGFFLARLNKGSRLDFQMTRLDDGVWLPKRIQAGGSARIALVKKLRIETDTSYSDYRKSKAE